MRLGQLARKLALRPSEIVEFLATHQIPIEDGSNTRLEDEHVALIIQKFGSSLSISENMVLDSVELKNDDVKLPSPDDSASDSIESSTVENKNIELSTSSTEIAEAKTEVIKAPKIELSGLKVVGKIELPELKKKEAQPVAIEALIEHSDTALPEIEIKPRPEDRKPSHRKMERVEHRPRKNPVALQRERESMEEERKRQEDAKRQKEQRTKNYLKKVKTSTPTKSAKLVDEPVEEMSETQEEIPKTVLAKFLRWLTQA